MSRPKKSISELWGKTKAKALRHFKVEAGIESWWLRVQVYISMGIDLLYYNHHVFDNEVDNIWNIKGCHDTKSQPSKKTMHQFFNFLILLNYFLFFSFNFVLKLSILVNLLKNIMFWENVLQKLLCFMRKSLQKKFARKLHKFCSNNMVVSLKP